MISGCLLFGDCESTCFFFSCFLAWRLLKNGDFLVAKLVASLRKAVSFLSILSFKVEFSLDVVPRTTT